VLGSLAWSGNGKSGVALTNRHAVLFRNGGVWEGDGGGAAAWVVVGAGRRGDQGAGGRGQRGAIRMGLGACKDLCLATGAKGVKGLWEFLTDTIKGGCQQWADYRKERRVSFTTTLRKLKGSTGS